MILQVFWRTKIHTTTQIQSNSFYVVHKSLACLIFQVLSLWVSLVMTTKYEMTYNSKYSEIIKRKLTFSIRRDDVDKWTLESFLFELCLRQYLKNTHEELNVFSIEYRTWIMCSK